MTAGGAGQVLVGAVRDQWHEIEAYLLLGPDVVHEDMVVTVGADGGSDLAEVLCLAGSPSKEPDHARTLPARFGL